MAPRVTALQVAGRMGHPEAASAARRLAVEGDNAAVRVSAAGTLGLTGGAEDAAFLEKLIAGPEGPERRAAEHALARLRRRTGTE